MNISRSILLVEDNPDDEKLMIRALRRANIANEIRVARNGEDALNILFSDTPLPIVVLLDIKLPKVDGLQVLQRLRADDHTKLLPVVILTSSKEERDILDSYNLGANSYVWKPIEFNEFNAAVKQIGLYWLLINEAVSERF